MSANIITDNPWKTLTSREVYKNAWIQVREDQVLRPDGKPGIYGVVESRIATGVLALGPDDEVYLVGQYRYPTNYYSWEIVEGGAEVGEEALQAAKRELLEEAGIVAQEWSSLGNEIHLSNCHSAERAYLFVARNLTFTAPNPEGTEVLTLRKVSFDEALKLVSDGTIRDALTIIAILNYASQRIQKKSIQVSS